MKRKDLINLFIFISLITWGIYRYRAKTYRFNNSRFAMDTLIEITIETKASDGDLLLDNAFDMIDTLDSIYSYYEAESYISSINSMSEDIHFNDQTIMMYRLAERFYHLSKGKYNIAIGQLTDIWDFEEGVRPDQDAIDNALTKIDFESIRMENEMFYKPEEVKLNFGSMAKGMIVDEVVDYLINNGAEKCMVNAGGDLRFLGYEKSVKIGIQHPRSERNDIIEVLNVTNQAVVTSGDYERFFMDDGVRYHHILDPETGYPATASVSVTVIADEAITADALSTTLLLLDPSDAVNLVNGVENAEAIIYYMADDSLKSMKSKNMERYINE